jgi:hypothetical protein
MDNLLESAAIFVRVLEQLGVPYFIVGSVASSAYGLPRATQDIDFVVALRHEQVPKLVAALELEFYVDIAAVHEAVAMESSFNLIRWTTMDKLDVFVRSPKGKAKPEFERRRPVSFQIGGQLVSLYLASPEDTLVHKLVWFRQSGEVSQQQWRDILGILKVQGDALDRDYLMHRASELGVDDLLQKAVKEAELDSA